MATLTRADIRQLMGRAGKMMLPGTTTSAGLADGSTLIDNARFRDAMQSGGYLEEQLILITSGTGVLGDVRRIKSHNPTTGVFEITPPASAVVPNAAAFEVWLAPVVDLGTCDGLEKALIHQAIDDALTAVTYQWRHYLTLVTDGDMELSGVTNWTAIGGSTITKVTTTVGEGVRSLRVQNAAINEGARTANIAVFEDEQYILEASVYAVSGTPNLIAYNVTNSTAIDTIKLADSDMLGYTQTGAWARLWATVDIPAGCRNLQVRLQGEEATADIYWENVVLRRSLTTRETLPSWVTSENRVQRYLHRALGERYGRENWRDFPSPSRPFIQSPASGATIWEHAASSDVLAVEGQRPYDALTTAGTAFATNDANSAVGDQDMILAYCMAEFYDRLDVTTPGAVYGSKRAEWAAKKTRYTRVRSERTVPSLAPGLTYVRSRYWP